jgi:UDP-N-acetylmuramyl pentapeptide phosphotransferase/UDP-N-acetylglucosamine-1-phosphate transferase
MPQPALVAAIDIGTGVIACLCTRALIPMLRRAAVLDRPNERSSHAVPTPRGGGIAPVGAILAAWMALIAVGVAPSRLWLVVAGAWLLAVVSWLDDIRGLSPAPRLLAQIIAVICGAFVAMPTGLVFQGLLPAWLDIIAAALAWLWFVNLFNFMDGIDGLAGSEAAAIGAGLVLFTSVGTGEDPIFAALSGAIALAAIGFLVWNWAPARVFLGDVGSVLLGYLLGFMLLQTAARGHWKITLILPIYFLADASVTLLRRLLRGERIWQAHRRHFYQQAVQRGLGHAAVTSRVIAANLLLVGCGWAAENGAGPYALAAAAAIVLVLLASLAGARRPRMSSVRNSR